MIPGRPALLGWRGRPRPSRTAPLGMTKTPTLRVSADMLVSQSRALSPGPPLWVTERDVPSRLRPALTLDKPRIGGGSGPNLSPVPKNRKHGCRPWWPFACPRRRRRRRSSLIIAYERTTSREDHRFGFRRANIFRQYQADLALVLAALGAQQRHDPTHFSFAIPRSRRS